MTTESISKQQRLEEKEGIDWISTLPDSILLHILSFLPTKTSVATMPLVSRRWRYLWKDLQVFDFYNEAYEETDLERFAIFVKAVLNLRRNRDIRRLRYYDINHSFKLTCPASINMCIRDAMGPRLEKLHLNIKRANIFGSVDIPSTLFDCINLVDLRLAGKIDLNVQRSSSRIYFPSLKKLYLHIKDVDSVDALLTGCPILETLNIIESPPLVPSIRFRVPPSLKRLKYIDYHSFTSTYIDIDAPCLKYLSITKKGILDIAVGNMQRVVEAYIDVSSLKDNESVKPLLNLLCAISETKHLTLCCSTTKLLLCAPILDFPVFRCLLHLDLELPSFNSKLLAKVIENCHVLQVFVILSRKKSMPLQLWQPQSTRIPTCLVSHLTSIHIKLYYGLEEELSFVEYILPNALVLKTIIIKAVSSMSPEEKVCILKKIVNIPRGSNLSRVEFD